MKALLDPAFPLSWLVGSLTLAILAPQLGWWVAGRLGRSNENRQAILAPLNWLAASLFFLLPPLGAWRSGALSLRLMGLAELDWIADLTAGIGTAALVIGITLLGWLIYRRTLSGSRSRTRLESAGAFLRALSNAAVQQWHWAFYRALLAASLPLAVTQWSASLNAGLGDPQLYWSSWLGLALIAVEAGLNPFTRSALERPGLREALLRRVTLAVTTTALFTLTGNFWLCLACDATIEAAIAVWFPLPKQTGPISSYEETGPATP